MSKFFDRRSWEDWAVSAIALASSILLTVCDRFPAPRVQAMLKWDAPAANEDGSPLTDLAGYKLYYGQAPDRLDQIIDVGNVTSYQLKDLPHGDWWFEVTAYDLEHNESRPSSRVAKLRLPLPGKVPAP